MNSDAVQEEDPRETSEGVGAEEATEEQAPDEGREEGEAREEIAQEEARESEEGEEIAQEGGEGEAREEAGVEEEAARMEEGEELEVAEEEVRAEAEGGEEEAEGGEEVREGEEVRAEEGEEVRADAEEDAEPGEEKEGGENAEGEPEEETGQTEGQEVAEGGEGEAQIETGEGEEAEEEQVVHKRKRLRKGKSSEDNDGEETNNNDDNNSVVNTNDENETGGEIDVKSELLQAITEIIQNAGPGLTTRGVRNQLKEKGFRNSAIKQHKKYIKDTAINILREKQGQPAEEGEEEAEAEAEAEAEEEEEEEPDEEGEDDEGGSKKRRRKSKKGKKSKGDSLGPKKPLSAYFWFLSANRRQVKNDNPDLKQSELTSHLGQMWTALDEEEKRQYNESAAEDKIRYETEMEDFKESNPEGYALLMSKKKRKGGSKEGKKRKKSDRRERGEDGYSGSQSEAEEEGKEVGWFDKAMHDIKATKRRKSQLKEEDKIERAKRFISRMHTAKHSDDAKNIAGEPAVCKLQMLEDLENECSKVEMKEALLDAGLLKAFSDWLAPLPGTAALPNNTLRTALYTILKKLPIDETRLLNSEGLGKVLMNFWKHKQETKENKQLLANLIQAWARPIHGLSADYRNLAECEDERSREIISRKMALGEHLLPAQKFLKTPRAKIPAPCSFDYAKRPQELFLGEEDDDAKKRKQLENAGSRGRLTRKVISMKKSVVELRQAAIPNITKLDRKL